MSRLLTSRVMSALAALDSSHADVVLCAFSAVGPGAFSDANRDGGCAWVQLHGLPLTKADLARATTECQEQKRLRFQCDNTCGENQLTSRGTGLFLPWKGSELSCLEWTPALDRGLSILPI